MTFEFTRMPWKDVVTMAADVAKNGFNVTHDLGKYSVMEYKSLGEVIVTNDMVPAIKKHTSIITQPQRCSQTTWGEVIFED